MGSDWYNYDLTGLVLCCLCLGGFPKGELAPHPEGGWWDVCIRCAERERIEMERRMGVD